VFPHGRRYGFANLGQPRLERPLLDGLLLAVYHQTLGRQSAAELGYHPPQILRTAVDFYFNVLVIAGDEHVRIRNRERVADSLFDPGRTLPSAQALIIPAVAIESASDSRPYGHRLDYSPPRNHINHIVPYRDFVVVAEKGRIREADQPGPELIHMYRVAVGVEDYFVPVKHENGRRPGHPALRHLFDKLKPILAVSVGKHFAVRFRRKLVSLALELCFNVSVTADNAVVNDRDPAARVRMGVGIAHASVRRFPYMEYATFRDNERVVG